jgi:predicted dehydrogenase
MTNRIRLGFIGANVHSTWASQSHFPALLASPDVELTAVCTTRRETAEAAREAPRPSNGTRPTPRRWWT